jgi:hypothetical protein
MKFLIILLITINISATYLVKKKDFVGQGLLTFSWFKKVIAWLKSNIPDAKKDDCIEYKIVRNSEVKFIYNYKTIAKTTNDDVKNMLHFSWIGE